MKPEHYETRKKDPLIKLNKTGILNFEFNFDYDILSREMIPLFDAFDANFIVYRVQTNDYCFHNITLDDDTFTLEGYKDFFKLLEEYSF